MINNTTHSILHDHLFSLVMTMISDLHNSAFWSIVDLLGNMVGNKRAVIGGREKNCSVEVYAVKQKCSCIDFTAGY